MWRQVNCARGAICNRDAVKEALESGKLAGYAGGLRLLGQPLIVYACVFVHSSQQLAGMHTFRLACMAVENWAQGFCVMLAAFCLLYIAAELDKQVWGWAYMQTRYIHYIKAQ